MAEGSYLDQQAKELRKFTDAFKKESDRGVAVLSMCALEEVVAGAIRKRLGPFEKAMERIVIGRGKWSNLALVAEAFGIFSYDERIDLQKLIEVRNKFAHKAIHDLDFDQEDIAKPISELKIGKRLSKGTNIELVGKKNRDIYIFHVALLHALVATRFQLLTPLKPCEEPDYADHGRPITHGGW